MNGALVGLAVEISEHHTIGDLEIRDLAIGDLEIGDLEIKDLEIGDLELRDLEIWRLEIGDLEIGDWRTSHLVNWVNLLSCITGDLET